MLARLDEAPLELMLRSGKVRGKVDCRPQLDSDCSVLCSISTNAVASMTGSFNPVETANGSYEGRRHTLNEYYGQSVDFIDILGVLIKQKLQSEVNTAMRVRKYKKMSKDSHIQTIIVQR